MPGAVEPMLPEALSNDAARWFPARPRRAVTAEMLFNGDEHRRGAAFYRSAIRSDARLDYEDVDQIFAGAETAEDPWAQPLAAARAQVERRRCRPSAAAAPGAGGRIGRAGVRVRPAGHVDRVPHEEQTESHKVIEHLMIAANEAVAEYLDKHHLPALYRVHEKPDPASVDSSPASSSRSAWRRRRCPSTSPHAGGGDRRRDASARRRARARKGHGGAALTFLVLRSLKQAIYSPQNLGHSGLRSATYCHFTSPIRRYPDLIVHRALLAGRRRGRRRAEAPRPARRRRVDEHPRA